MDGGVEQQAGNGAEADPDDADAADADAALDGAESANGDEAGEVQLDPDEGNGGAGVQNQTTKQVASFSLRLQQFSARVCFHDVEACPAQPVPSGESEQAEEDVSQESGSDGEESCVDSTLVAEGIRWTLPKKRSVF